MPPHLRKWWLPYLLLWLVMASSISLEGGHTELAEGATLTGFAVITLTGLTLAARCMYRGLRHILRRNHSGAESPPGTTQR